MKQPLFYYSSSNNPCHLSINQQIFCQAVASFGQIVREWSYSCPRYFPSQWMSLQHLCWTTVELHLHTVLNPENEASIAFHLYRHKL